MPQVKNPDFDPKVDILDKTYEPKYIDKPEADFNLLSINWC